MISSMNHLGTTRRDFVHTTIGFVAVVATPGLVISNPTTPSDLPKETGMTTEPWFRISLAQWSLHRALRAGDLLPMDFPEHTRKQYGIEGVEYVSTFYGDRKNDPAFPGKLRQRAEDAGVQSLLIMVDGEGPLGAPDEAVCMEAVSNHRTWLDIAKSLGCHSIRVNANSEGTPDEQLAYCAKGMSALLEHADALELNVLIENHGGHSSNGAWLSNLMKTVDNPRFGTLPDFGNFILDWNTREEYDRYRGTTELMPWAKAVSAKSHAFNSEGLETGTDYERMIQIVKDAGYRGWIGVEYEGPDDNEASGIEQTRDLLMKLGGAC